VLQSKVDTLSDEIATKNVAIVMGLEGIARMGEVPDDKVEENLSGAVVQFQL